LIVCEPRRHHGKRAIGIVTGEAIIGANIFRDMFAAVRDVVGGRSATYERLLAETRELALSEIADTRRSVRREWDQAARADRSSPRLAQNRVQEHLIGRILQGFGFNHERGPAFREPQRLQLIHDDHAGAFC
jgi:hypothetical protein